MANTQEQMDSMLPAVDDDTRSTQEYLEDTKPMDVSSVPAFKRPIDASTNDQLVGEDDAGNPVYRTMLGNTYTVRRNPDQRTTITKIKEDVLPAVKKYLEDPTAPTADQAIAAAKAIAGDAWETLSIPGDLLSGEKGASDVTLGQVFELTGGTAAASTMFDVPGGTDTLRIFGGPGAKSYGNASLLRAERLRAAGASPAQIEAETGRVRTGTPDDYLDNKGKTLADISPEYANLIGVRDHMEGYIKDLEAEDKSTWATDYPHIKDPSAYIDDYRRQLAEINEKIAKFEKANPADEAGIVVKPQNPFKFEIDDSQIEIKSSDGAQTLAEATKQYPIIVRNIIPDHKELFKEYPNLEYVEFYVDDAATYAHFSPTRGRHGAIVVNPKLKEKLVDPNNESFRNTFFHELQHAAQFQDERIAFLEQLGGGPTAYGKIIARSPNSQLYEPLINRNEKLVQLKDEIVAIFEKQRGTGALDQRSTGARLPGQVPNPSEVFGDVKVAKQIARKMRELDAELFKTYISTASEIEARIAGNRAKKLGKSPTSRVVSDLSNQRGIETREEYWENKPKSSLGKKKAQAVLKLGSITDEEILRYANGAINFARYAVGIDSSLLGFDASGPIRGNYAKGGLAESKGLSWGELIVDNILGLDNKYESFGEKLGKAINEDEIKFLKDAAIGVYEGTKEFVQAPVETTKQVVGEIKDSVTRLGSEDLNTRLQRMYGVSYDQATDEQVNQAREAVLGDALTALELVPAAKGATTVAKAGIAAVPGGLKADVIGQTKAMLSGDREFLSGTPTPKADAQPAGAQVPGMFDRKTPEEMQDYQKSTFEPPEENNPAKLMQELQEDANMSTYDFGIGSDGFLNTAFTPVKIRYGSQVNMRVPIERYLRETGLYGRISEAAREIPAKSYVPASIILDDFNEMVANDILTWYNEMLPHMLADASPEKIFRLAAHLNMYPDRDWRREENRSLIEELAEEIYDEIDTSSNFSTLKITNPTTLLPNSARKSEKLKFERLGNDNTGRIIVRPIKPDVNDKYDFYDILGDGADEFKLSLKPYLAEGIIDFLENNFERYIPETLVNPSTGTSTTRENLLRGVRQEWEEGPNLDLQPLDTLREIEFKSLGKELLENFKSRVGNKEFVTGAEVLKVLENDPRMNPKTIPNWMKTAEYKNKKIPVTDLQGTIDYYSATSPQVSLKNRRQYTSYQRQFGQGFVGGEFKDYVEIIPSTSENQQLFSGVYSHYGPRALSHTRATVLNKGDAPWKPREAEILGDEDYMLVEEFQSDLVQQGSQNKKNIEYSPIKKSQEALELNLQSLIAEASKRGITKIVIPPFSKIAAARLMGERLDLALQNKSRSRKTGEIVDGNLLYRIYVTELNKVLDKFEKSYPITVHRNAELPYQGRPGTTSTTDADEINEPDFFNLPDDDEIFDAAELNDPNVTEADIITEDELLNDIAEMMDEDGNIGGTITDQILKDYEEPKPESIGGGYILDISKMDKEFKLQEPKFAEGGAVGNMNRQMSFAFEDGGLRDDGMMRDPVSGNEVPPGSTAKEVRDDIPAQLSEGEYVVPADVVRYYGVKFFEDLRDNAKMGLQDMESRGRIGGEPVPAGGPMNNDDLSPEEMAAIQEMMGMAEGGAVNMYKQQQDLYSPPNPAIGNPTTGMAAGGEVRGYQPGGLTQQQQAEQGFYTAGQQAQNAGFIGFPLGATIFPSAGTGTTFTSPTATTGTTVFTPVNMINMQTGVRVTATTQADYDRYISEGYVVDDGTLQPKGQGSGGGGGGTTPPPTEPYKDWLASADFNSAEGLEKFVAGIEYDPTKDKTMGQAFGATLMGGPMAGIATAIGSSARGGLNAISDLRAASLIAKAQGLDKLAAKYDKQVADIIEKGPGILDFLDDVFASGKQKANAWAKKNGFENIQAATEAGVTPTQPIAPKATPEQTAAKKAVSEYEGLKKPSGGGDDDPFPTVVTDKSIAETKAIMDKQTSDTVKDTTKNLERTTAKVKDIQSGKNTSGQVGFDKGGLMVKGKKKKK